jgi:hypothetical protein
LVFLWKPNLGFDKARGITNGRGKYKNLLNCLVGSPWFKSEDSTSLKTVNWIKEAGRCTSFGRKHAGKGIVNICIVILIFLKN